MHRPLFLLLALLALPFCAFSQENAAFPDFGFEHLTRADGLSNQAVSSIVQDSQGYIWFGTQNGLDRYDGTSITLFEHDPFQSNSLSHNLVQTMFLDKDDILWVGTYSGLNRLDTRTGAIQRFVHDPGNHSSISNNIVVSIKRDTRGRLWVGTLDGLNLLDEKAGTFTRFMADGKDGSIRNKVVRCIVEDKEGRLWIGTGGGGLHRLNEGTMSFEVFSHNPAAADSLPSDSVMSISISEEGQFWVGCWGGGLALMTSPGHFRNFNLEDERIYTVHAPRGNFVYAGTWGGGLFLLDTHNGTTKRYVNEASKPDSLSHNTVYSIFTDRTGLLWVGTNGGGLNKFSFQRTRFHSVLGQADTPGALGKAKVVSMVEDRKHRLWIGTYNGGVYRKDPETGKYKEFRHRENDPESLSNDVITHIYEDRSGTIWICTTHGINRWKPETDSFQVYLPGKWPSPDMPDDIIYDIVQTADGAYWLATYNKGLARWDPSHGDWTLYSYDPDTGKGLRDNLVYSLLLDRKGMIWACTNGGLSRMDPATREIRSWAHDQDRTESLSFNTVRMMIQDREGRYWIATTGGGLDRYDPETDTFIHHNKRSGLSHNTVNSIVEDPNGALWMGTQEGLCVYNPETDSYTTYTDEDGLQDIEFSSGYASLANGNLLFGGPKGYSIISDFDIKPKGQIPPLQISNIQVYNRIKNGIFPASLMKDLVINPDENYFSFNFAVMDFNRPEKNKYAWMLEGFEKEWVSSSSRNYAFYTNIPPGEYRFKVKGANAMGIWNEEGKSIRVIVLPPAWLSWWAILIYLACFVILLYLLIRLRTAQVLGQKVVELQILKSQLEEANHQLEFLSTHDQLTGIANRRALDQRLWENWAVCQRNQISFSVIMVDVDFFKQYNDKHGHLMGDLVLKAIAAILGANIRRNSDLAGRYGGEEFMVLLPGTPLEGAVQVAEELRVAIMAAGISRHAAIRAEDLPALSGIQTGKPEGEFPEGASDIITISLGTASMVPSGEQTSDSLVTTADQALYRAKANGRNRVCT